MTVLENDETAQKKGFVAVAYHVGCSSMSPAALEGFRKRPILRDAIPLRLAALHYCYDNPKLRLIALFAQNFISKEHRLRFRAHFGTYHVYVRVSWD